MNLRYVCIGKWPPNAWLAFCPVDGDMIVVHHGRRVENAGEWFCEAVWDGPFEDADFDTTDIVFGSGGRVRGGKITFVCSASTVDRLQYALTPRGLFVSNSLACLLAAGKGALNPRYHRYYQDFRTITHGIEHYKRTLLTSCETVNLLYYDNLEWDGRHVTEIGKPRVVRNFRNFDTYCSFLRSSIQSLSRNMTSENRRHSYRMLGTLSTGYDSPTVTVLAEEHGLEEVVSFDAAGTGEYDSGREIAEILGIKCLVVGRDEWMRTELPEIPFIAADAKGEDVYFRGAQSYLGGRVLLTGFHGDKVWGRHTKTLSDDIVRGDQSGLSLTEFRLWAGFIHLPVPFLGVQQIRDINVISNSQEMMPWSTPGWYDRPICRRIVEEAGVPRNKFGNEKKAASVIFFKKTSFLSDESLKDYHRWLKQNPAVLRAMRSPANLLRSLTWSVAKALGRVLWWSSGLSRRLSHHGNREVLFQSVYPWAMSKAIQQYAVDRLQS